MVNILFFRLLLLIYVLGTQIPMYPIFRNSVLLGSLQLQQQVAEPIRITVSYKGMVTQAKTELDENTGRACFEFNETDDGTELYLLFTERIVMPTKDMAHQTTHPLCPYRLFRMTKEEQYDRVEGKIRYRWHIAELNNEALKRKIPDNTLIIWLPSTLLEKVEPGAAWHLATNIVYLPSIHIKKINKKELIEYAKQSEFYKWDIMPYHEEPDKTLILCSNQHLLSVPATATFLRV
ncbi:MAG: hypothetical protein WCE21_03770 [Candidatus Babeliales bacterium]